MASDGFLDQYIKLVRIEIQQSQEILAKKDFRKKADFTKVQGRLQGLEEALSLLNSVPEDD